MDRLFAEYFLKDPGSKSTFYGYKVFSEQFGRGRGDSAVVYLHGCCDDVNVGKWWRFALENDDFRSSVDMQAEMYGLRRVGSGLWGLDYPRIGQEEKVLGINSHGSAGALIGNVIGVSFWKAAKKIIHRDLKNRKDITAMFNRYETQWAVHESELIDIAKRRFGDLKTQLYSV